MTSQPVSPRELAGLAEELHRTSERLARFERSTVLARQKAEEGQAAIAAGVLANGEGLRTLRTELLADNKATRTVAKEALAEGKAVRREIASLDAWMRARFATDDEEKGRIIAEVARLDKADAEAAERDSQVNEEITSIHRQQAAQHKLHEAAVALAEQERAKTTLRAGVAAALPSALFAFLKEHPHALTNAYKAILGWWGHGP